MPEVAQIYLGNIYQNQTIAERITKAKTNQQLLEVNLNQSDRAKGRISCTSTSGVAIGIIKSRSLKIKTGDVYQTEPNNLLLIRLISAEVLILSLPPAIKNTASQLVQLGHLLGNQHYPIQIQNHKIYVQLSTNQTHLTATENSIIKMIKELEIKGLVISKEQVDQPLETSNSLHLHKHSH